MSAGAVPVVNVFTVSANATAAQRPGVGSVCVPLLVSPSNTPIMSSPTMNVSSLRCSSPDFENVNASITGDIIFPSVAQNLIVAFKPWLSCFVIDTHVTDLIIQESENERPTHHGSTPDTSNSMSCVPGSLSRDGSPPTRVARRRRYDPVRLPNKAREELPWRIAGPGARCHRPLRHQHVRLEHTGLAEALGGDVGAAPATHRTRCCVPATVQH